MRNGGREGIKEREKLLESGVIAGISCQGVERLFLMVKGYDSTAVGSGQSKRRGGEGFWLGLGELGLKREMDEYY